MRKLIPDFILNRHQMGQLTGSFTSIHLERGIEGITALTHSPDDAILMQGGSAYTIPSTSFFPCNSSHRKHGEVSSAALREMRLPRYSRFPPMEMPVISLPQL
jgi:hypothetical protein